MNIFLNFISIFLLSLPVFSQENSPISCDTNYQVCNLISPFLFEDNFNICKAEKEECFKSPPRYTHTYFRTAPEKLKKYPNKRLRKAYLSAQGGNSAYLFYPKRIDQNGQELPVGRIINNQRNDFFKDGVPTYSNCSAVLVSEDEILTAFHCTGGRYKAKSPLKPGKKLGRALAFVIQNFAFYSDNGVKSDFESIQLMARHELYKHLELENEKHDKVLDHIDDLVLIKLKEPIGKDLGYFKIYQGNYGDILNKKLRMSGYPSIQMSQGLISNHYYFESRKYVSEPLCEISFIFRSLVYSNCMPLGGISGGALYFVDESGSRVLVGILSAVANFSSYQGSKWVSFIGLDL
ncbi:MAG: hypothetical protein VX642_10215 [Bdellovibrionota bacterium]|nr:hypothetical protein [Bdellovibrionota bacterium]